MLTGVCLAPGAAPISLWNLPRTLHPQTVTLAWDESPDPTVIQYNLYQGMGPRAYTNFYTVLLSTNLTLTNIGQGVFYFAVTAVNSLALESDYSNEVTWTNLPPPPVTNFLLSVSIQQSGDFTNWTTFTNAGQFQATNTGAPIYWRALMNIQPQ